MGFGWTKYRRRCAAPCLDVMRASLSDAGYQRTRKAMKLNGFLGELVDAPLVMGEFSYIFCLFGTPSRDEPWGWQLFGHHLTLNCVIIGDQMTLTPTFMGAEPSYADAGRFAGISLFEDEERLGLALRRSLDERQARTGPPPPEHDGRRHAAGAPSVRRSASLRRRLSG